MKAPYICFISSSVDPAQSGMFPYCHIRTVRPPAGLTLHNLWTDVYNAGGHRVPDVIVLDVPDAQVYAMLRKFERLAPAAAIIRPKLEYDSAASIQRDVFRWQGNWDQLRLVQAVLTPTPYNPAGLVSEARRAANAGERRANDPAGERER